jgi:HEPN domain-containing protein
MSQNFLSFGKIQGMDTLKSIKLSGIGKSCFVLVRIWLRRDFFKLLDAHVLFHLMHHSIEVYLKAIIVEAGKKFKNHHNLIELRNYLSSVAIKQDQLLDILYSKDVDALLNSLDSVYSKNKYGEVGYNIDIEKLRSTYDKLMHSLIISFFQCANRKDRPVAKNVEYIELTEAEERLFNYGDHPFKLYIWPSI